MNISEAYNASNVTAVHAIYKCKEEALFANAIFYYVLGTVIVLSNSLVVFSSGLILTKGLIICPAKVSALTVGLIAVDRYIYIVHGLHYQRWFSTKTVRGAIIAIWIFSIILSFMPATGWTNKEFSFSVCSYISLMPKELILLNSFLGLLPVLVVACLYSVILFNALKTVDRLKQNKINYQTEDQCENQRKSSSNTEPIEKLKIGKTNNEMTKSASFHYSDDDIANRNKVFNTSKSTNDLQIKNDNNDLKTQRDSVFSIYTIASSSEDISDAKKDVTYSVTTVSSNTKGKNNSSVKLRAVGVVLLTTSSFIVSLVPFYVALIIFENCENKLLNPRCIKIRSLIANPLALFIFVNSILNPLIYAWWHKGFQQSVKYYYKKYVRMYLSRK